MEPEERTVWIDEKHRILSFHPIDDSKMITKVESLFWDFISELAGSGYRIL